MQVNTKILFLVVLYEQDFNTSQTLKSIVKYQDLFANSSVIIWDNSKEAKTDIEEINSKLNKILDVEYFTNSINTPLSQVYNFIFENKIFEHDYISLLDHDSELTKDLIYELLKVTSQKTHNLILPRIIFNSRIVSPAKLYFFKGIYFKKILDNQISTRYLTAINSGMTIKTSYLINTKFRYDENLKFYGTDDYFMKFFQKNSDFVYILDSKINHTLNYFSDEPITKKVWRFKQMMHAIIYLNDESFVLKLLTSIYVFFLSIKESISNRSLKFILLIWKN